MENLISGCTPALELALEQRSAGNIEQAIETLLAAAGGELANADLAVYLGQMLAETGQMDRAEPWLRHGMKLAPDDLIVRGGFGAFLAETGRLDEAMAILTEVRREARSLLASPELARPELRADLSGFIASTETNLARVHLDAGRSDIARELAGPYLTDEQRWGYAHGVFAGVVDREGLDPKLFAEECLEQGRASPYMVCHLLEHLVADEALDFGALDRLITRADALFTFDWRHAAPELEAVLAEARRRFGRAVMLGDADAAAHPRLASLTAAAEAVDLDPFAEDDAEPDQRGDDGADAARRRALVIIATSFLDHWRRVRDDLRAGADVARARHYGFFGAGGDDKLAFARAQYSNVRATHFASLTRDEALTLTAPWAEDAVALESDEAKLRELGGAEYAMFVDRYGYSRCVVPVSRESLPAPYEHTADGMLIGGSMRVVKTTGELFEPDEAERVARGIEWEFADSAHDAWDEEASISAYPNGDDLREILAYAETGDRAAANGGAGGDADALADEQGAPARA